MIRRAVIAASMPSGVRVRNPAGALPAAPPVVGGARPGQPGIQAETVRQLRPGPAEAELALLDVQCDGDAQARVVGLHDSNARDLAPGVGPLDMHDGVDRTGDLQPYGVLAHAGERAKGRQPGRHSRGLIRVDGPAASRVSGVHGREQLADLSPAAFAHHQPVRPHPQGLADQFAKVHGTAAFQVSVPGFQRDDVRVDRIQFRGVLNQDESFPGVAQSEQRRQ